MSTIENELRRISNTEQQRSFRSSERDTKGRIYGGASASQDTLGSLVTSTAGQILSADNTVSALLAFSPEHTRGKQILDFVADAERPFVEAILLKHASAGIPQKFMTTLKPEKGHPFEAQVTVGVGRTENMIELHWSLNLPRSLCDRGTVLHRRIQAVLEEINLLKMQDLESRRTIEQLERRVTDQERDLRHFRGSS